MFSDDREFVRFVQATRRGSGIADLTGLPKNVQETLQIMRDGYTAALRLERSSDPTRPTNARFYFNYIESPQINAVAFKVGDVRFIGITVALLNKAIEHAYNLRGSSRVQQALSVGSQESDRIGVAFFNLLVSFVVTHEYAHHYWGHIDTALLQSLDEFTSSEKAGLDRQVREVVADGYAAYLVMEQLLQGDLRQVFVSALGLHESSHAKQSRALLSLLVLVVGSFFALYMTAPFDSTRALTATHPPPATRMAFLMEHVQLFVRQNPPVGLKDWFDGHIYRSLVRAATDEVSPAIWLDESRFRASEDGGRYVDELTRRVNAAKTAGQPYT